ncbi:ribosomal RNA small subunit methyltransferase E [Terrihabitans soli]|uniref:Ribosomal RNA small subunit methyltransferase E n=1 Tax=Terrihabitans soli TaxID=708113 RepID=A0A6S6QUT5_9HYPH|nr:16S rRNA (uracil(1498)-N(3))-methyltransferase [Terrihabitans soli]BCJ91677.1 ribosomal RNA small subunit methyltransferase E [Terrihabitans soli]
MAEYDFSAPRLFLDEDLKAGAEIALSPEASNYLRNVLRLQAGSNVLVFNGRDGEWRAEIADAGKKKTALTAREQVRTQTSQGDLWYLFAPLKHARLDYMVQKAVEMGVTRLQPVMTRRTQSGRVNLERMRANAVEAAEQCGILSLPEIEEPVALDKLLAAWPSDRSLIFCDEDTEQASPLAALGKLTRGKLAVLIGPEGGFDDSERTLLSKLPQTATISLGPRVLRADTAAVVALALVQASLGDF